MTIASSINKLSALVITFTVFLLPLFFLPFTFDMFEFPKYLFLLTATLLLLLLWAFKIIFSGKVNIATTPLTFPLFLFTTSFLLSLIFISVNKIQPLISAGSTGTILTLFSWYILLSLNLRENQNLARHLLLAITLSLALLSLIGLASFSGITSLVGLTLPAWAKSTSFSPAGTPLNLLTVMIVGTVISGAATFLNHEDNSNLPANNKRSRGGKISEGHLSEPATLNEVLAVPNDSEGGEFEPKKFYRRGFSKKTFYFYPIAAGIILMGTAVSLYQISTSHRPILLPLEAGWAIAIEGLKQPKTAFLGIGPDDFVTAFTLRKPVKLNTTSLWNTRFAISSNYYLHLLTTVGTLGFLSFAFILYQLAKSGRKHWKSVSNQYRHAKKHNRSRGGKVSPAHLSEPATLNGVLAVPNDSEGGEFDPKKFSRRGFMRTGFDSQAKASLLGLISIFALYLFVPSNIILLFLLFTLSALVFTPVGSVVIKTNSLLARSALALPIAFTVPALSYLGTRAFAAEYMFSKAMTAIGNNQAQQAYQANKRAIMLNPFLDRYYLTYSQTNQAIAISLAENMESEATETDRQQETITRLVQQAITAGKNAVSLNPSRASNWENLALLYRKLTQTVPNADQWAIKSYQQAIKLDPANPKLRLNLGGVYYGAARFDEAIDEFKAAISLKPNFANGFYNLAAAYREKGDLNSAVSVIRKVLTLVPSESSDFDKARKELEELEKKITTTAKVLSEATESARLLQLPATPSSTFTSPVPLPTEAAPPSNKWSF